MKNNNDEILVTIVVVTYNSTKFVLETLESAKNQTYANIELIITDDCSFDGTINICKNWIELNNQRFIRTEIVTVNKNTGIPANFNRGLNASQGSWIKFIAGDDVLFSDAIEKLISFQYQHKSVGAIHGGIVYIDKYGKEKSAYLLNAMNSYPSFWEEFRSNKIHTPTVIFKKSSLLKVGSFNLNYKIEDMYIFLKLLSNGEEIYYIKHFIAKYRMHDNNTSSSQVSMLEEHLKILSEYKGNKGYYLNLYIFCRNIVINMFGNTKFSLKKSLY